MEKQGNTIVVQTERRWGILAFLLVFVLGAASGLLGVRRFSEVKEIIVRDTTYIHDTTRIVFPPEVVYIKTTDTLLVHVRDTLIRHDTTYLVLHKEEKEYRGKDYYAKVSGYRPSLDYIEVYPKTTIVTTRIDLDKNSISIGAAVGYSEVPSIPIYLEYERMLHENFSAHGRIVHDLIREDTRIEVGGSVIFGW